jgi:hypothetical protein
MVRDTPGDLYLAPVEPICKKTVKSVLEACFAAVSVL